MKSAIQLSKLRLDGGTQPRVKIDTDVVQEYAERIKAGDDFPPVEVFHDGAAYWLAEGFHRYHAHASAGKKTIGCNVRKGTVRDAILFSCGANIAHGLQRSTADKQRAVATLLNDAEWAKYSDRKIAEICCVSQPMVSDWRKQLKDSISYLANRIGRDGKSRPATQPKRTPAVVAAETWEPDDDDPEPDEPARRPVAKGETNVIGDMKQQLDEFVDELLDGQPPYIAAAVSDHLEAIARRLRKGAA